MEKFSFENIFTLCCKVAQHSDDFLIAPTKNPTVLDASQWPLLLKVYHYHELLLPNKWSDLQNAIVM